MELERSALLRMCEHLRLVRSAPEAEVRYDMLSDALYWSDELPDIAAMTKDELQCLKSLLRYRTTMILGNVDTELAPLWNDSIELVPTWPGFQACRSQGTDELRRLFDRYHQRAIEQLNAIPD